MNKTHEQKQQKAIDNLFKFFGFRFESEEQRNAFVTIYKQTPYLEMIRPLLIHEYITTKISYQGLANKYGITKKEVSGRCKGFKKIVKPHAFDTVTEQVTTYTN